MAKRIRECHRCGFVEELKTKMQRISLKEHLDRRATAVTFGPYARSRHARLVSAINKLLTEKVRCLGKLTVADVITVKVAAEVSATTAKVPVAVEDVVAGRVDATGSPHDPIRSLAVMFDAMSLEERRATPRRVGDAVAARPSTRTRAPLHSSSGAQGYAHDTCALVATRRFISCSDFASIKTSLVVRIRISGGLDCMYRKMEKTLSVVICF